jgi:hypothetical protein
MVLTMAAMVRPCADTAARKVSSQRAPGVNASASGTSVRVVLILRRFSGICSIFHSVQMYVA